MTMGNRTTSNVLTESDGFNRCVRARTGYMVYNRNDTYVGASLEKYGEYCESDARMLRQLLPPGGVAIDVGANIGAHTIALAKQAGTIGFVIVFKPQRIVFQTLCANLAINSIVNVDAHHAAVGGDQGFVRVPELDYGQRANFGGLSLIGIVEGRRVPLVRLDDTVRIPRLDLIKIDVEGMELDVLRGADQLLQRYRPFLYVENDRADKSAPLIRHLRILEYRLYWKRAPLFNPNNFFDNPDNIFPNIACLNLLAVPLSRPVEVEGMTEVLDAGEFPIVQRP